MRTRGQYADRNSNLVPWLNRFDFRVLQDIYTTIGERKNTLQLSVDIFNVGNLLNSSWGVRQTLNGAQTLLTPTQINQNGPSTFQMQTVFEDGREVLPVSPFRDVTSTSTTWSMQIGLRYIF